MMADIGVSEVRRMKLLTINAKLPIRFLVLFAAGFVDKGKLVNFVRLLDHYLRTFFLSVVN